MLQPIPYLNFDGDCNEAMEFYAETFGGKVASVTKAKDTPMADQMPPEFADKIVNARLELPGGGMMYGGDRPPHMPNNGRHGMGLALLFDTAAEGETVFNKLAEGGQINMPYEPSFWAEKFGMVTDKYGVDWMVNGHMLVP